MKLIKMFGLAVIAAVASMALLGASSAMAESTVLCKVDNELPCKENAYTGHIEAVSTHAKLTASFVEILCTNSTILGEALGLASPLVGHVTELTFTECEGGTVTVIDETGLLNCLKVEANLANCSAEGFAVLVNAAGLHCVYGGVAEGLIAHGATLPLDGNSLAKVLAPGVTLSRVESLFLCPATSTWTATYSILLPHDIFISS